jgi:hypothetical protein
MKIAPAEFQRDEAGLFLFLISGELRHGKQSHTVLFIFIFSVILIPPST